MSMNPNPPEVVTQGEGPVEVLPESEAFAELHLLYNYADDDSRQFTRWQMVVAMEHGRRLRHTPDREAMARWFYDRDPACGWRTVRNKPSNYAIPFDEANDQQREDAYRDADAIIAMIEGGGA